MFTERACGPVEIDLLNPQVDIVLYRVDHNHLKQRPLYEVFPPIQTFNQVGSI